MNKVILIGRLGKDPEMFQLQSGMAKASVSLATNGYKDKDGNQRTDWHRLVAFDKTAEIMGAHLTKGRMISVEGRLQNRSYEDKTGEKRSITEVVVDRFEFLSPKDGNGNGNGNGHAQAESAAVESDGQYADEAVSAGDPPF